jgi:hypothetical protein
MTITVYLRQNQTTALSWGQVDTNFIVIAAQVNANTAAIAALGGVSGGTTGSRPGSPVLYQPYFDTTLGYPVFCSNTSPVTWVDAAGVAS